MRGRDGKLLGEKEVVPDMLGWDEDSLSVIQVKSYRCPKQPHVEINIHMFTSTSLINMVSGTACIV